jgi:hypothetical protein
MKVALVRVQVVPVQAVPMKVSLARVQTMPVQVVWLAL